MNDAEITRLTTLCMDTPTDVMDNTLIQTREVNCFLFVNFIYKTDLLSNVSTLLAVYMIN